MAPTPPTYLYAVRMIGRNSNSRQTLLRYSHRANLFSTSFFVSFLLPSLPPFFSFLLFLFLSSLCFFFILSFCPDSQTGSQPLHTIWLQNLQAPSRLFLISCDHRIVACYLIMRYFILLFILWISTHSLDPPVMMRMTVIRTIYLWSS